MTSIPSHRLVLPLLAAAVAVAMLFAACEPLDSDTQGDAQTEPAERQDTAAVDTAAARQAVAADSLATRMDALADAQRELGDRVDELHNEMDTVKMLLQTQGPDTSSARAEYQHGLELFYQRRYAAAADVFRHLLDLGRPTDLLSNCQYWIGECAYGEGRYRDALAAFERVEAYAHSTKLDDAQMMLGMTCLRLGDRARARRELQTLIERYPESEYVPRARRLLASL